MRRRNAPSRFASVFAMVVGCGSLLSGCTNPPDQKANAGATQPVAPAAQGRGAPTSAPIKIGEPISLGPVYWINRYSGCASELIKVERVEVISGGEFVDVALSPQAAVRTWQCGNDVPGALIMATARKMPPTPEMTLKYYVYYQTVSGPQASSHTKDLLIRP